MKKMNEMNGQIMKIDDDKMTLERETEEDEDNETKEEEEDEEE